MNFKSSFILVIFALLISACESSVTDPVITIDDSTTLEFNGGLNIKFDTGIKEFNKRIRIINQENDSYLFALELSVQTKDGLKREQALLSFIVSFDSDDGIFQAGNYILAKEQIQLSYGNYDLIKSNADFARYSFEGISAILLINESNSEFIKGRLSLDLKQLSGKRMVDGQVEDVILSAPIRMLSDFNLEF